MAGENDTAVMSNPWSPSKLRIFMVLEGIVIVVGNLLLAGIILSRKKLRKKEFLTMAGLAIGDALFGGGILIANIRRIYLSYHGGLLELVTPWTCMGEPHTYFFIVGEAAGAIMLVVVSMDRLLAIKWFSFYFKLGQRYAWTILALVYGYVTLSVPVLMLLSRYAASQTPSVMAMCLITDTGPSWFSKQYLPNLHLWSGIVSIVIFVFTVYYLKKNTIQNLNDENMNKQRKFTKAVGITVLCTLVLTTIPQLLIIVAGHFYPTVSWWLNPACWLISNMNNMVNIFIFGIQNTEVRSVLKSWTGKTTQTKVTGTNGSRAVRGVNQQRIGQQQGTSDSRRRGTQPGNAVLPGEVK